MNPFSMNPLALLIGSLITVAIGFGAGWTTNGWRKDAEIDSINLAHAKAVLAVQTSARLKEQQLNKDMEDTLNEAKQREKILRADASGARNESERLRGDIAAIRGQLPSLTEAAVRQYADTASVVFDECQRAYQGLAETADLIDSDRQTLMDAWPK